MTTSTEAMISRLKPARSPSDTPWGRIAAIAAAAALIAPWPSTQWQHDPVGFARDVVGVEPWERQVEVLEAVRDHDRVAVASGHKVSKSHTAAIIALWFYCSFPDARVVMTCVTSRQVDEILWRETKALHARAKVPIDGTPREMARTGLTGDDGFRQVRGFTAKEGEAVAGISGPKLLYIVDEASGVPDSIFEALEGNRAGGAKLVLFSNPTRTEGEHFEAFHGKSEFYRTIRISSEESPNVRAGRVVIPGLATAAWVDEKRREWGVDSALYKVRVRGEHVKHEEGKVLSLHLLEESEQRWDSTPSVGRLYIGIDPAGPGEEGDESTFSARRGLRQLALLALRGLSGPAHLAHLLGLIAEHGTRREQKPVVVVDGLGQAGAELVGALRAHLDKFPDAFELVVVRGSDNAVREPQVYDHVRDELWANLARWAREGGALLSDAKLVKELHAPSWIGQLSGRLRVTPKKELRKILGRSPDRADATALSVWEPLALAPDNGDRPSAAASDAYQAANDDAISPYDGRGLSPYGMAA